MVENQKKKRVVFTLVEAGLGHIIPATAIADAFEEKYGDKCEIIRTKIFGESQNPKIRKYQDYLINDTKKLAKSWAYSVVEYYASETIGSNLTLKFLDNFFKDVKEDIMQEIVDLKPDLIFSSYYSPSHFAIMAKKKGLLDCVVATYTPDPIIYSAWDKRGDIYITNNSQAYNLALKKGFKKDSLYQIPFILRNETKTLKESKIEIRKKLGLPKNKFTILLCDGAYAQKNLKKFAEILMGLDREITVIAMCGKNEEVAKYLEETKAKANPKVTVEILGFVDRPLEYIKSADLFVGKGGANALVEAFYMGAPAIVSAYANVLEKHIAKYYIRTLGCGLIIKEEKKFKKQILDIIDNPDQLEKYKENLKDLHDDSGAEKAADILYEKLMQKDYAKNI